MSSVYPSPHQRCQRCGTVLPSYERRCNQCGFQNLGTPDRRNSGTGWPQYGNEQNMPSWGNEQNIPSWGSGNFYGSGEFDQPEAFRQPGFPSSSSRPFPAQTFSAKLPLKNTPNRPPLSRPRTAEPPKSVRPSLSRPRQGRRHLRAGRLLLLLLLLVVLIGAGVFGYFYLVVGSVGGSPLLPNASPLFSDSFDTNNNHWDLQSMAGRFSAHFGDGALTLEDEDHTVLWDVVPGNRTFADFKLYVDATLANGDQNNGYGVYVRGSLGTNGEWTSYYRFSLYGDGSFAVFKGDGDANGKPEMLVGYMQNAAIQKSGTVNHLVLTATGASLTFAVNGQQLAVVKDGSYARGAIALFVLNQQDARGAAQATFSHLAIYPPNA